MMSNFISINPYTEETLATYDKINTSQIEKVLQQAEQGFLHWKQLPFKKRAVYFEKLKELIITRQKQLAELAVIEMGKPYKEALAEVLKCTTACDYYAAEASTILAKQSSITDLGKHVEITYEPMGVILGIFPWNFPYWQIMRSTVPVLMGGNSMLVKPSPNTPQCSLAIQQLFEEAGFPLGVVQTIFADEGQISDLIKDKRIKACTLTGSDKAGASVASQAALQIKKSVLELGGSDPFIVLADADIQNAVDTAITARFQNNGQSCIAAKRFILHEEIADDFLNALIDRVKKLVVGNPLKEGTNIGPMARKDLRDKLDAQVKQTLQSGAKILFRHEHTPKSGFFYPPSVLSNIPKNSAAYCEELFGPVLSVFIVGSDEEAIQLANDSDFGLGAALWTSDTQKGKLLASQIETGQVFINGLVKSHARYPFGGVKRSGFGRELGEWGIREFCHVKTIWN